MRYLMFDTEQEAAAAEAAISVSMGMPLSVASVTQRWATPQQIPDGRWVFPSPDDQGEDPSPDWFPQSEYL